MHRADLRSAGDTPRAGPQRLTPDSAAGSPGPPERTGRPAVEAARASPAGVQG